MRLRARQRRPERRSNDGQSILKPIQMASDLHSELEFLVELWGFEPQTSCMPYSGNTSTEVHLCRLPSQNVRISPPESRPVAVLSCCTVPSVHRCKLSGLCSCRRTLAIAPRLYPPARQDRRRRTDIALMDDECVPPIMTNGTTSPPQRPLQVWALAGLGQSFWVEILSATALRSAVISASIQDW